MLAVFLDVPETQITETTDAEIVDSVEERVYSIGASNLYSATKVVSPDDVRTAGKSDETYKLLINMIETGFPTTRSLTPPLLREFFEVQERLYTQKGVVYLDQ